MLNLLHHTHAKYRKLKNDKDPAAEALVSSAATTGGLKVVADVNTPDTKQSGSIWRGLLNASAQRTAQVAPDTEERNLEIPPVAQACIDQERLESALSRANMASPTLVRRNSFEMRNQSCPELRKQWSDIAAKASPKQNERRSSFESQTRLQSVGSGDSAGNTSPDDRRRRNSLASFIPSCGGHDDGDVGSSWKRRVMSFTGTDKLSKEERAALDALRDACKRDRKKEKKHPLEASEVDPVSSELVGAALADVADGPTSPELIAHVERAFERERLVFSKMKLGGRERRNSFVVKRTKAKDPNMPLVVATQQARDVVGYRDVMMTRSICDWSKSVWVLPHPEVHTFELMPGEHMRVVMASDGMWDIMGKNGDSTKKSKRASQIPPSVRAASIMARINEQNGECSQRLLKRTIADYKANIGRIGDDTTIMVVDLNLTGKPPPKVSSWDFLSRVLWARD